MRFGWERLIDKTERNDDDDDDVDWQRREIPTSVSVCDYFLFLISRMYA